MKRLIFAFVIFSLLAYGGCADGKSALNMHSESDDSPESHDYLSRDHLNAFDEGAREGFWYVVDKIPFVPVETIRVIVEQGIPETLPWGTDPIWDDMGEAWIADGAEGLADGIAVLGGGGVPLVVLETLNEALDWVNIANSYVEKFPLNSDSPSSPPSDESSSDDSLSGDEDPSLTASIKDDNLARSRSPKITDDKSVIVQSDVVGIDVSDHQGFIDWSQVAGAGYSFAFVKATEGEGWTGDAKARQQNFEANMQGASSAGMLIGTYHFARPDLGNSAEDEARWFVDVAGDYIKPGYLRPVLDIQVGDDALGGAALSSWIGEWIEMVKSETGVEPLIYTNADYADNYLEVSLAQYDLWVAHWTYDTTRSPNIGIWDTWAFWQYSDEGHVLGISGDVDLDLFKGSESELSNFVIEAVLTGTEVSEEWNRTFGGAGDDRIVSIEITSDGGYILAGGTSSFGTTGEDAWLIKTDEAGNELWENTFGGAYKAYDGVASSVQLTKDGGFIFTEYNCGIGLWPEQPDQYDCNISVIKVDSKGCEIWREFGDMFKPIPDGGYLIACPENYIKINSQGNEIWRKQIFPIWGCCGSNYLLPSSDDGFILILWNSSFDYDSESYERMENYEWMLTKRDAEGNEIWNKDIDLNYIGYIYSYHALSVYPAADGGYILAGGMCRSKEKNSSRNAWIVKTDSQGDEIWRKAFDGYSDVLLRPTSDGGFIACLWICSESENSDSLLIKADGQGNVAWNKIFDGRIGDIQTDPDGGYILSQTKGSEDIGSSSWVIKIDTHGNDVWTKAFDGDICQIRPIPNGGYILAGSTSSFCAGGSDAWLIKLAPA